MMVINVFVYIFGILFLLSIHKLYSTDIKSKNTFENETEEEKVPKLDKINESDLIEMSGSLFASETPIDEKMIKNE